MRESEAKFIAIRRKYSKSQVIKLFDIVTVRD